MMDTLEHRVRRYLLARLRRRAVLDLYEMASVAGLLEGRFLGDDDASGTVWRVPHAAREFLAGARIRDCEIVRRMIGLNGPRQPDVIDGLPAVLDDSVERDSAFDLAVPRTVGSRKAGNIEVDGEVGTAGVGVPDRYVIELLKAHRPAPNPLHVAVSLLVARAVGTSLPKLSILSEALQAPTPFILIKAPVARFEASVGMMLEDGLLLPFRATLEDVMRDGPLSGRYPSGRSPRPRRTLKTLAGSAVAKSDDITVRRRLRRALIDEPALVVVVDETSSALTPVVTATADLVLECGGFDRALIADLLGICVGVQSEYSLRLMEELAFDPEGMSLDDLVLAVRPGRSAREILTVLTMLVDRFSREAIDNADVSENDGKRGGSGRGGGSSAKNDRKPNPKDVGIEVIEPMILEVGGSPGATTHSKSANYRVAGPSVETLSGYGAARDWAIDLKADLALWHDGSLSWDEMSTKLLLSGPPGTGKTTYAKALCNTLQVPLLATSVAHWLEPGYLGDVLKRMSAAFELAAARAPAVLFIDEIDGIGSRQAAGGRNYDDYWVSVINRLLELLDGAAKTEGVVIVAATNLPEKIDAALLRSGRLETHVRVPLPDIDTLTEILAHHLGADLAEVVASAPTKLPLPRLKPPKARDHDPRQLRRNSEKRKNDREKGVKS